MNRPCEHDGCGYYARPNRRTCNTHRRTPEPTTPAIDENEVDFVVRERAPATGLERGEKILVASRLAQQRVPSEAIAQLAGVSTRTIHRWIADTRAA